MTFATRQIDMTLSLAKGSLNDQGDNQVSLAGHRCDVIIENAGASLGITAAQMRIFGMRKSDMDKFSTMGMTALQSRNDEITIRAGDSQSGMFELFAGVMNYAIPLYNYAPDVALEIYASPGLYYQMLPAAANTYQGASDVATIIESLCMSMGYAFENHGVTTRLHNQYLYGTLIDQLGTVVRAANIICTIDRRTVRIWPNDSGLDLPVIDISPDNGLIGYPTFTTTGLLIEMEYRNDIQNGRKVKVTSSIPQACGTFEVQRVRHELSTQTPDGNWKTVAAIGNGGLYIGR